MNANETEGFLSVSLAFSRRDPALARQWVPVVRGSPAASDELYQGIGALLPAEFDRLLSGEWDDAEFLSLVDTVQARRIAFARTNAETAALLKMLRTNRSALRHLRLNLANLPAADFERILKDGATAADLPALLAAWTSKPGAN